MISKEINAGKIILHQGDITEMKTDAIVNAANEFLKHGGGVAGAIVRKGGQIIQDESNKIGHTSVGTAAITTAGSLNAKYVIHAVGPRMGEGAEDEKLEQATKSSLNIAAEYKLKSITFPAISTGIFGYPLKRCSKIMINTCKEFLNGKNIALDIYFCLWTDNDFKAFKTVLNQL